MQLPLIRDPFHPMPHGAGQYLVVVQNRKGERDALARVDTATWDRTTPLIQFVGPRTPAERMKSSTISSWAKNVGAVVGARPCFVDVVRLRPTQPVAAGADTEPALSVIHRACRRRGMRFIPVIQVGQGGDRVLDLVAECAAKDGRGVCLRYDVMGSITATGQTGRGVLEETLKALDTELPEADLLLDLGWLDPDVLVDVGSIRGTLRGVNATGQWRSVVLLGTSIPATMGCIAEGTVGRLRRHEWDIWQALWSEPIDRMPSFGDYGIQNPKPPFDAGGPGMRANVRYTEASDTIVARGTGPWFQEGNEQYRELCERIVDLPEFCGRGYTWGDDVIADCADGVIAPGAQGMWRGAGCSHHIRYVADQVARVTGAS